jgi:hypothetical protein
MTPHPLCDRRCRPLRLYDDSKNPLVVEFDELGLQPRLRCISGDSFRAYANLHIVCWLGNHLAFDATNKVLFVVFAIPAVLLGADYVYIQ